MGWTEAIAGHEVVRGGGRESGDGWECQGTDYFGGGVGGGAEGG